MLRGLSKDARTCYQYAARSREKANELPEGDLKEEYLEMEQRWLRLARSYDFSGSLKGLGNQG